MHKLYASSADLTTAGCGVHPLGSLRLKSKTVKGRKDHLDPLTHVGTACGWGARAGARAGGRAGARADGLASAMATGLRLNGLGRV